MTLDEYRALVGPTFAEASPHERALADAILALCERVEAAERDAPIIKAALDEDATGGPYYVHLPRLIDETWDAALRDPSPVEVQAAAMAWQRAEGGHIDACRAALRTFVEGRRR